MAESDEGMKFCTNCKRNIAAQNFMIHSLHCQRNLVLCKLCNECYPRNLLPIHIDEDHEIICCCECGVNIEKLSLEEHKKLHCKQRLIQCRFCGIENPLNEMKEHENYCGSRTERCHFCHQFVMIRDKVEHCAKNHKKTVKLDFNFPVDPKALNDMSNTEKEKITNTSTSKVNIFNMNKRTNDMPQVNTSVPDQNTKSVQKVPLATDVLVSEETLDIRNDCLSDEIIARQIAEEEQKSLVSHQSIHRPLPNFDSVLTHSVSPENLIPAADQVSQILNNISDSESEALRNESHTSFPADMLYNSLDKPCELKKNTANSDPDVCLSSFDVKEQEAILTSVKSKLNVTAWNDSKECVPCEFCEDLIPLQLLIKHEVDCQNTKQFGNEYQNDAMPLPRVRQSNNYGWRSINSDENVDGIPCEFCEALFSFNEIGIHQTSCNLNPLFHGDNDLTEVNNDASDSTLQNLTSSQNLLNFSDDEDKRCSFNASNSFIYDDTYVTLPTLPIGRIEKSVIDKNQPTEDSSNFSEQNKNLTKSTSTNIVQVSNPPCLIRSHLLSPSTDHVFLESPTIKTSLNQISGNKENNVQAELNSSDHVFVNSVERNQMLMKKPPLSSFRHSERNNYLKNKLMLENTNNVGSFQEKENFPKKNIINHKPDKSILQARNTYHRGDIQKVDKDSVNDESCSRSRNHQRNSKIKNCDLNYHSVAPKSLYLNEMKATLHPVSKSHSTEVHSCPEAAVGGARPKVQNESHTASNQRNCKRNVQKSSKFQEPKTYFDENIENSSYQSDNSSNESLTSYLHNTNKMTGAVPKSYSHRNTDRENKKK